MNNKMSLLLKMLLAVFIETILYIFLHEGGHALVAVLCGAKITSFSIVGAYVISTGGNYTQVTSSLQKVAGALLPVVFSVCYILFGFNKNKKGEFYRIFSMFSAFIPIGSLFAWVFVPVAFMAGDTEKPDDVIQFLNISGIHPVIVMSISAALILAYIFIIWKRGILQIWLDIVLQNK